jgi:hypothetical protein
MWSNPDIRNLARELSWRFVETPLSELAVAVATDPAIPYAPTVRLATGLSALAEDRDLLAKLLREHAAAREEGAKNLKVAQLWVGMSDSPPPPDQAIYLANMLDILQDNWKRFAVTVARHDVRVAVVGNSPCELGLGRGADIDSHDIVFRMNRFSTESAFAADYGRKTDMVITTHRDDELTQLLDVLPRETTILIKRGLSPHHCSLSAAEQQAIKAGRNLVLIPEVLHGPMWRTLGGPASTGLFLTSVLHALRGPLPRSSFFGFSFVDQLVSGVSAHYFEKSKASELHDWRKEAEVFAAMFA